ncbi:Os06g0122500 [Oryza sativa Japonica Group]|uniref:Os06g0122500 protein n=1 Tax=Oryza sativa subsp. japonica TaxID=39947 RepID=Q5VQC9_ORYSJ|nr:unknown protein [Oryza sativa Japonica Group]BAH93304.1 Os06g0122500 [Oryza sativa Japonica Group]|eukprot:NP_001174576.1 Os06g0122500 [Oryza sativa Japonica Group]
MTGRRGGRRSRGALWPTGRRGTAPSCGRRRQGTRRRGGPRSRGALWRTGKVPRLYGATSIHWTTKTKWSANAKRRPDYSYRGRQCTAFDPSHITIVPGC